MRDDSGMIEPVLIAGTGAMACLFAARLSAAGVAVTMLGTWQDGLAALRRYGVRLQVSDVETAFPVNAVEDPGQVVECKLALVLTKAWQTERVGRQLVQCLASDGLALTLQNGMGNRETLEAYLGPDRVAAGSATLGATLLGPGLVKSGGEGVIRLSLESKLDDMAATLTYAGFALEREKDIEAIMWAKLVINAAINPLTALLDVCNGELLRRPSAEALMAAAATEAACVAKAHGVRLPFTDPVAAARTVAERTASNHSSMLQDVRRRARTENDAISGAVVRLGEKAGVDTPVNRTLWQLVQALEASYPGSKQ